MITEARSSTPLEALQEVWKSIPSLPFKSASSLGRIRNDITGRIYSRFDENGYLRVKIAPKGYKVHRLVAEAFLGPCPDKFVVNHKNGIRDDNRVANLEYCTNQQNVKHAYDTGLADRARELSSARYKKLHADGLIDHCKGTDHRLAKLCPESVREIRTSNLPNTELAKRFGVCREVIRDVKKRKTWKHVT